MVKYKEQLYKYDVAILKKYGDFMHKLSIHKVLRTAGLEVPFDKAKKGTNDKKELCNIRRTKSKIFELAYCNPFDYFVTLTLSPNKQNRYDINSSYNKISQWLQNYKKKHNLADFKYLLIPEQHKDGAWHLHGLFIGLPLDHLILFTLDMNIPNKLREKIQNGDKVYYWQDYKLKFGWITLDKIRDQQKVSAYITKYISKSLSDCIQDVNAKMYYCSQGLKRAETIKKGSMVAPIKPDFENEYCKIKSFYDKTSAELSKLID